jgi:hypothetical protein
MFFTKPDLTTGSRPALLPDETLLFVQDSVGLYEGWVVFVNLWLSNGLIRAANTKSGLARKAMLI